MALAPLHVFLWCVAGIIISVALPLLAALLPRPVRPELHGVPPAMRPYVVTGLFAAVASLVIIAMAGDTAASWNAREAMLAGYAWDATLQKLRALY